MISMNPVAAAAFPIGLPVLEPSPDPVAAVDPARWVPLEELMVELCRERSPALAGCETVVDCEPSGLRAPESERNKIRRCVALLLDTAMSLPDLVELDISVRPAGSEDAPLLVVSLRAVARNGPAARIVPSRDPDELALLQLFVERSAGSLLISQVDEGVRRLSLGLEVPWLVERPSGRVPGAPALGRALVADDCPMVRRTARRLLERAGLEVVEAPGTLALLAHLDPEENGGSPPDWLFVDEAWIRPRADGTRGLRGVLEASVAADRVVVLTAVDGEPSRPAGERFRCLAKPLGSLALQTLFEGPPAEESRNEEGERPSSLSR